MRILLPFLILLSACGGKDEKHAEPGKDSVPTSGNKMPENISGKLTLHAFNPADPLVAAITKDPLSGGASWTDADGDGMVILVQSENRMINERQGQYIKAYCFRKDETGWKQRWLVQDQIAGCEVDATCAFFPGSLAVTDLDNNGVAEISFLYRLSCKGDVSPDDKKLIMYEGAVKYAIRGTTIMEMNGQREGGEKRVDPAFQTAPAALLDYANSRWEQFGLVRY